LVEELFKLPVDIGTVNFGSPLVGSGILANSKGYVVGLDTTGPEISRIEERIGLSIERINPSYSTISIACNF